VLCGSVQVPLDYSGATAGQLALHVEELPVTGTPRGAVFLVAGGPGQASSNALALGRSGSYWHSLFPGYTLIVYDDRATGRSAPLSCPALESASVSTDGSDAARLVGQCGESLGPARAF
jgi:pimeloyl-ACP methyl ester carboxylesterase